MIDSHFFTDNRRRLVEVVADDAVIVLGANAALQRRGDAAFLFEQESNFWFLTGIAEPDWWLVIDTRTADSWLVSPTISETKAVFDGSLPAGEATKRSGIHAVISRSEGDELLKRLARKYDEVYSLGDDPQARYYDFSLNPAAQQMSQRLASVFGSVRDCRTLINRLRAIKQPAELAAMQRAIDLTVDGFDHVRRLLPQLQYEYQVESEFSYYFRSRGAEGHGYEPIVAAGVNACTLHYGKNTDRLGSGELLLLDIGARVDGYSADITRTYALGQPTSRQTQVHQVVQSATHDITARLAPGVSMQSYLEQADATMRAAVDQLVLAPADYRRYFPHAISHGLGIDVHDSLAGFREFQPGMVLTVEPGIYIPEESLGVRIEDNILITETGYRNLSQKLSTDLS